MAYPPRDRLQLEQIFKDPGLHVLVPGTQPIADIIAVHGLAAHAWYTWTKALPAGGGRAMWLRDFLPTVIPFVRILMYSYESNYLMNASKESLRSIASKLVEGVHTLRCSEEDKNRPIIFLGHSFGGVVIEEALLYANQRDHYRYLSLATSSVVFLGTPHRGTGAASWAKVLAQCATALGSNTQLVDTLTKGSERLALVVGDFVDLASQNGMRLVCFYETLPTEYKLAKTEYKLVKTMVVEKSSATIEGYESVPLHVDHCDLNKFESVEDDNFKIVSGKLKELAELCHAARRNVAPAAPTLSRISDKLDEVVPGVKLPVATEAPFNSAKWQHDPFCLLGTRVKLLEDIDAWSTDPQSRTIYWLCGMAGTGKSTIARTVAKTWHNRKQLAASFIFSRGHEDLSQSRKFVTTIASQLCHTIPATKKRICDAIKANPDISRRGLHDQWTHLILQPLSAINSTPIGSQAFVQGTAASKAFVLVIDALDECDNGDDIRLIIHLLETLKSVVFQTIQLRVFITSRPEVSIRLSFKSITTPVYQECILHHIKDAIVQNDISRFLNHELGRIKRDSASVLAEDWPGNNNIKMLADQADKLFIYASTVCRFIGDTKFDPSKRLSLILDTKTFQKSATGALDAMYTTVLQHSVIGGSNDHDELSKRFRSIVGPIVILFDALSAHGLTMLLGLDKSDVNYTLNDLGSVIDAPEGRKIRLLHPSFRDFLLEPSRCINSAFQINKEKIHYEMFLKCLGLISTNLRKDICGLRHPGVLRSGIDDSVIEECLPSHLQYACLYWVSHLQQARLKFSDNCFGEAVSTISNFFRADFLHWLEALSLINHILEGCTALIELEDTIAAWSRDLIETTSTGRNRFFIARPWRGSREPIAKELDNLASITYDSKRFLFNNGAMIEKAPLQTYCAALIFSPAESKSREHFWSEVPPWLKARSIVPDRWSPMVHVCRGHEKDIRALAFSPDSRMLASASNDTTIGIWDPRKGTCQKTLLGHFTFVTSVIFSPDGKLLASASTDKTVMLWDPHTGTCLQTLKVHSDGNLLESASTDRTVRNCLLYTGSCRKPSDTIPVVFSPDGRLLASASYNTVSTWDLKTGPCQKIMDGHSGEICSLSFSPDNKLLASASLDMTIRIWDLGNEICKKTIGGHFGTVCTVVFSPNSRFLASASLDNTIRISDPDSGACQKTLKGLSEGVPKVVFSPDGSCLALTSNENCIRIWNTTKWACMATLNGHSTFINDIVFSPDGKLLASASLDRTVRIWDTETGKCQKTLNGHSGSVRTVVFSPDGGFIASGSSDSTIRIWDPLTIDSNSASTETFTLIYSENKLPILSFPNSRSSFPDQSQSIITQLKRAKVHVHSGQVNTISFSPDGKYLASASEDRTIKIWDPKTGKCQRTMKGHSDGVSAVAFSPDGKLLASSSKDRTVRTWIPERDVCQKILRGHCGRVNMAVFSPDGEYIASASDDKLIRIWNWKVGTCTRVISGPMGGNLGHILTAIYSPDGKLLVSASTDQTVRIWDPSTTTCLKILSCSFSKDRTETLKHFELDQSGENYSFVLESSFYGPSDSAFDPEYKESYRWDIRIDFRQSAISPTISIKDDWVKWGNENLHWLPPFDMPPRRTCLDSRNNLFAIVHDSGGISFLEFAEGPPFCTI